MPHDTTAVIAPPVTRTWHIDRWFHIAMAFVAIAVVIAGFAPGIVNPSSRNAPLTPLVAVHGVVFMLWLLLFVVQTTLIAVRRTDVHRRLGIVGGILAVAMLGVGYSTAIAQGRRGFDLSGDLGVGADPLGALVFPLGDLVTFATLVGAGLWYRRRADIHKRLMLLATIGALMPAPLAHLIGHNPYLRAKNPAIILIPITILLSVSAVHDLITRGRVHPVSLWGAVIIFVWANLRAAVIGPSAAWHEFAGWLVR